MVAKEMLDRIMGAPNSPTGKLVAMRRTPGEGQLETGVWYSNFMRVKGEAEKRGLPFFGMWTNGDLCGFCRRFTLNILEQPFLDWMKESGGLFWLGGSMDDNDEDKRGGIGFKWGTGPYHSVSYFPFFGVSLVKDGKTVYEYFGSGHDYDRQKKAPEGTPLILQAIKDVMDGKRKMQPPAPRQPQAASPVKTNTVLHIRFNPEWDAAHIARFQNALKESGGHCICQKVRTPDTMCMCKAFLEQDKPGPCHCGAFEKYAV